MFSEDLHSCRAVIKMIEYLAEELQLEKYGLKFHNIKIFGNN